MSKSVVVCVCGKPVCEKLLLRIKREYARVWREGIIYSPKEFNNKIKELQKEVEQKMSMELRTMKEKKMNSVWNVGKNYLLRTVTHIYVGKLVKVTEQELVLSNVSWVADTGRFMNALRDGLESQSNSEIEPFPTKSLVVVGRSSLIDAVVYDHVLPTVQK